jgi:hypothetical protein
MERWVCSQNFSLKETELGKGFNLLRNSKREEAAGLDPAT